jgi:flagellar hook-basal body complex protein FliE
MQVSGIGGIGYTPIPIADSAPPSRSQAPLPFAQLVQDLLHQVGQTHAQANQAVEALALGQTDNLHEVLLRLAQADLTFRFLLEIRNRLTEAYQEIMRMQV